MCRKRLQHTIGVEATMQNLVCTENLVLTICLLLAYFERNDFGRIIIVL
jgi:hypothetical protein